MKKILEYIHTTIALLALAAIIVWFFAWTTVFPVIGILWTLGVI